jgi:hypothetical protein
VADPADPKQNPPSQRLTPAERAQLKRDEKLADMKEQVDSGRLTIRQLTDEEREAWAKRQAEREAAGHKPRRKR